MPRSFDLAACIWVSLDEDTRIARQVMAHKVAYYGHALSPLIYERLGLRRDDFLPIQQALTIDRDESKAVGMVTDQMLRIGVVGNADELIARLKPLVAAGVNHVSFGPPLGPDPLAAVKMLGREVLRRL
jgi:5,10-methylenetetrahydromethanopterin reductase